MAVKPAFVNFVFNHVVTIFGKTSSAPTCQRICHGISAPAGLEDPGSRPNLDSN